MHAIQQKISIIGNTSQLPSQYSLPHQSISSQSSASVTARAQNNNTTSGKEYLRKINTNDNRAEVYHPQHRLNTTNNQRHVITPKENQFITSNVPYNIPSSTAISSILKQKGSSDCSKQIQLQAATTATTTTTSIKSSVNPPPSINVPRSSNLNIIIKKDSSRDQGKGVYNFFSAREGFEQDVNKRNGQVFQQFDNSKNNQGQEKSSADNRLTQVPKLNTISHPLPQPPYGLPTHQESSFTKTNGLTNYYNQNNNNNINNFNNQNNLTSNNNNLNSCIISQILFAPNNLNTTKNVKISTDFGIYENKGIQENKDSILQNLSFNQIQERKSSIYYQVHETYESDNNSANQNPISTYRNLQIDPSSSSNREQNYQQKQSSLLASQKFGNVNYNPMSTTNYNNGYENDINLNNNSNNQKNNQLTVQTYDYSQYYQQQQSKPLLSNQCINPSSQREYINYEKNKILYEAYQQEEECPISQLQSSQKFPSNVSHHSTKKLISVVNKRLTENGTTQQNYFQQSSSECKFLNTIDQQNQHYADICNPLPTAATYIPNDQIISRRTSIKQDNPLAICELQLNNLDISNGYNDILNNALNNFKNSSSNNQYGISFPNVNTYDNCGTAGFHGSSSSYIVPPKISRQRNKTAINTNQQQQNTIRNIKTSSNNLSINQQTVQTNRSYDIITNHITLDNSFVNEITPTSVRSANQYQLFNQQQSQNKQHLIQDIPSTRLSQHINDNQPLSLTSTRINDNRYQISQTDKIASIYQMQEINFNQSKGMSNKDQGTSRIAIPTTATLTNSSLERNMFQAEKLKYEMINGTHNVIQQNKTQFQMQHLQFQNHQIGQQIQPQPQHQFNNYEYSSISKQLNLENLNSQRFLDNHLVKNNQTDINNQQIECRQNSNYTSNLLQKNNNNQNEGIHISQHLKKIEDIKYNYLENNTNKHFQDQYKFVPQITNIQVNQNYQQERGTHQNHQDTNNNDQINSISYLKNQSNYYSNPNSISTIPQLQSFNISTEDQKSDSLVQPSQLKFTGVRKSSKSVFLQNQKNDNEYNYDINCNNKFSEKQKNDQTLQQNHHEIPQEDIRNNLDIKGNLENNNNNVEFDCANSNTHSSNEHQIPNQSKQIKISLKSQLTALNITQNKNTVFKSNSNNASSGAGQHLNNNNSSSNINHGNTNVNIPLKSNSNQAKRKNSKSFINPSEQGKIQKVEDQQQQLHDLVAKKSTSQKSSESNTQQQGQQTKLISNLLKPRGGNNIQNMKNQIQNRAMNNESKSLSNSSRQSNVSKNVNSQMYSQYSSIFGKINSASSSSTNKQTTNDSKTNISFRNKHSLLEKQIKTKQSQIPYFDSSENNMTNTSNNNISSIQIQTNRVLSQNSLNTKGNNRINTTQNDNVEIINGEVLITNDNNADQVNGNQTGYLNNILGSNTNRISFHCNNPNQDLQNTEQEIIPSQRQNNTSKRLSTNYIQELQKLEKDLSQIKQNNNQFLQTNQAMQENNPNATQQTGEITITKQSMKEQNELKESVSIQNTQRAAVENKKTENLLSGILSNNNSRKLFSQKQNSSLFSGQSSNEMIKSHKQNNSLFTTKNNNMLTEEVSNVSNDVSKKILLQEIQKKSETQSSKHNIRNSVQLGNILNVKSSSDNLNNLCNPTNKNPISNNQKQSIIGAVSKSLKGSFQANIQTQCNTTRENSISNYPNIPLNNYNFIEEELTNQKKRLAENEFVLSQLQDLQKQQQQEVISSSRNSVRLIQQQNINSVRSQSEYEYRQNLICDLISKIHIKCNDLNEDQSLNDQKETNIMTFCNKQNHILLEDNNHLTNDENLPPSYLNQQLYTQNNQLLLSGLNRQGNNCINDKFNNNKNNDQKQCPQITLNVNQSKKLNDNNNSTYLRPNEQQPLKQILTSEFQQQSNKGIGFLQESVSPFSQPFSSTTSASPNTAVPSPQTQTALGLPLSQLHMNVSQNNFRQTLPPKLTIEEQLQMFELEEKFKKQEICLKSYEEIQFLVLSERIYQIDYNSCFSKNPVFNAKYRCSLVDWMQRQTMKFYLKRETIHKAIYYLDLYLSKTANIKEDNLYLIAITCIFMASKQEEIYPPSLNDILSGSQYASQKNIISEQEITIIEWKLNPITGCFWLDLAMAQWDRIQENCISFKKENQLTFRERNELSYGRYREAYQLLDCLLLDVNRLKCFSLRLISVSVLYLVLCKYYSCNTDYPSNYIDNYLTENNFFQMFQLNQFEVKQFARECSTLYQTIYFDFELPNALKQNNYNQRNYEEFLAFQSYTSNNKQALDNLFCQQKL